MSESSFCMILFSLSLSKYDYASKVDTEAWNTRYVVQEQYIESSENFPSLLISALLFISLICELS